MTLTQASYAAVKSRGTRTEVTDANRQESRQKTGKEGAKRETKGGREGPQVELACRIIIIIFFCFFQIVESALPISSALQSVPC